MITTTHDYNKNTLVVDKTHRDVLGEDYIPIPKRVLDCILKDNLCISTIKFYMLLKLEFYNPKPMYKIINNQISFTTQSLLSILSKKDQASKHTLLKVIKEIKKYNLFKVNITVVNKQKVYSFSELHNQNNKLKPTIIRHGFVYIIKSGAAYKIGCSTNVEKRVKSLQTSSYFNIEIALKCEVINMYETEMQLHIMFNHKQIRGEWFDLDERDLEKIKVIFDFLGV